MAEQAHFRRPVAVCALDAGQLLVVANRDSGSLSVIDTQSWEVAHEQILVGSPSAVASLGDTLLVADRSGDRLLVMRREGFDFSIAETVSLPTAPVTIAIADDSVSVASLWARQLTLFKAEDHEHLVRTHEIPMPFAPHMQCFLPGGRLLAVADSFRARVALVDVETGRIEVVRELPGHNIRGMAVAPDGDQLYLAQQLMDGESPTTRDAIHWGDLVENVIRVLPLSALFDHDTDLVSDRRYIRLGSTGNGAADPGQIAFIGEDQLLAVASGVDHAAIFGIEQSVVALWIETERRPTAVCVLPEGHRAVAINTLADSLSIIDTDTRKLVAHLTLGPTPPAGPKERGESLFFDGRLSHDGWMSCHSCHTDGHANGLLADTSSDGSFGTPKRILSLLGTRDNTPWAWDGRFRTLNEQVQRSVVASMHASAVSANSVNDIVAYLHSLDPPPPVLPDRAEDVAQIEHGRRVFHDLGCAKCHVPPLTYTSDQLVDVGLTDEAGQRKFNPPSLRGVSQRDSLLHDGRARSLEDLFQVHGHQLDVEPTPSDFAALLRFLRSL